MSDELETILTKYKDVLSDETVKSSSYTLQGLSMLKPVLRRLKGENIETIMDLGCGYGVLTLIIAEYLNASLVFAVDIDDQRLAFVNNIKSRATTVKVIPLHRDFCKLVDVDEKVQLITSFGSLEHTTCWDEVIESVKKILIDGGYFLISMPNLSSWVNRLALLLGYQPRDLEISEKRPYGVMPIFKSRGVAGHIKIATFKAFKEYLTDNGFEIVMAEPLYDKRNLIINLIDRVLYKPSLSRRFLILARYTRNRS